MSCLKLKSVALFLKILLRLVLSRNFTDFYDEKIPKFDFRGDFFRSDFSFSDESDEEKKD